jgi:hypothetical protein
MRIEPAGNQFPIQGAVSTAGMNKLKPVETGSWKV